MNHANKRYGFTIIELVIAMGFVSVLLIAIAMTVIQIGNIYNRGITLKDVNQAGRSLTSELLRSINQSAPFLLSNRYVQQNWGGRLCLGQYSYIWNYGKALTPPLDSNRNVFSDSVNEIRFVKVLDPNASYCTKSVVGDYIDVLSSEAVELLNVGQHNLAIHDFIITTTLDDPSTPLVNENTTGDSKTGQQLYSIVFTIGTNDQLALDFSDGLIVCKPPSETAEGADPSYCSINQFNILARSGNTVE